MLRIERNAKTLKALTRQPIPQAGLKERTDLQHMIRNNPEAFFEEMGEKLLLIGEEIRPETFVEDRIDLLALDQNGAVVVIELKRGAHKLQLLQALSYAGMVSNWDLARLIADRRNLTGKTQEESEEELEEFLLDDIEEVNQSQRVVLLAEDFDYEVLITAKWLNEKHEVDIRCYRMSLAIDGQSEYLSCTCIYPPPEITQHAARRGREGRPVAWEDWSKALESISNKALVDFLRRELEEGGSEAYLRKRMLRYRIDGKRRFHVTAHAKRAYVWQTGRFQDDEQYWSTRIGAHADVKAVKDGSALRFYLVSDTDFARFKESLRLDLRNVEFFGSDDAPDLEPET